ncbi:MAG: hypothetical protein RL497_2297 [Pseudomonadota bacterium]
MNSRLGRACETQHSTHSQPENYRAQLDLYQRKPPCSARHCWVSQALPSLQLCLKYRRTGAECVWAYYCPTLLRSPAPVIEAFYCVIEAFSLVSAPFCCGVEAFYCGAEAFSSVIEAFYCVGEAFYSGTEAFNLVGAPFGCLFEAFGCIRVSFWCLTACAGLVFT